jgi:hypothetical protein
MSKLTAKDKKYFAKVTELGCCICRQPPQIHHCTGAGMGLRSSNRDVMPLCHYHHVGAEGIHTIGVRTWEKKYGTQEYWINWTRNSV